MRVTAYTLLIVVLAIVVTAAPPGLQEGNTDVPYLSIEYPKVDGYKFGENVSLCFRVFDYNNTPVTNATTTCQLGIAGPNGTPISKGYLEYSPKKYCRKLDQSTLEHLGLYPFVIQCNKTVAGEPSQYGFLSSYFEVTNTGVTDQETNNLAFVVGAGIIAFIMLYFAFNLGEDNFLLKLLMSLFALLTIKLIPVLLISMSESVTGAYRSLYLLTNAIFYLYVLYISVYIIYHWAQKSKAFAKVLPGASRKMNKNDM